MGRNNELAKYKSKPKKASAERQKAPVIKKPKTKTFTGCWTCRERHRKCDLRKPFCLTCERNGLKCLGFTIRLCWDVSKSDNLRRTVIYDHTLYDYMTKPNNELDYILANIDELNDKNVNVLPFTVFKVNDQPTEMDLLVKWLEFLLPKKLMPLLCQRVTQIYVRFIKENLFDYEEDVPNVSRTLLRQIIISSTSLWFAKRQVLFDLESVLRNLNTNIQILHEMMIEVPQGLNDKCLLLTSVCNLMLLSSLYPRELFSTYSVNSFIKISKKLMKIISSCDDNDDEFENVTLREQLHVLKQIFIYIYTTSYTVDDSIDYPFSLIKNFDAELNFKDSDFVIPSYSLNMFIKLVLTFHKLNRKKSKNSFHSKVSAFKIEDHLSKMDRRFYFPNIGAEMSIEKALYFQSYLFYCAFYITFLRNNYTERSISMSNIVLINWSQKPIKFLNEYYKNHEYAPGCLWSILVIGLQAKNKDSQNLIMEFLMTLSRFNLEQVDILISAFNILWLDPSQSDVAKSMLKSNIGFVL